MNTYLILSAIFMNAPALSLFSWLRNEKTYYPLIIRQISRQISKPEVHNYDYGLPYRRRHINNNEDFTYTKDITEKEIYLCPPEEEHDIQLVEKYTMNNMLNKYCLIEKTFEEGTKKFCKTEPQPVLKNSHRRQKLIHCHADIAYDPDRTYDVKKLPKIFPVSFNRRWHSFVYQDCGSREMLEEYFTRSSPRPKTIGGAVRVYMYQICYDHEKLQTVYTEHNIWSPPIFKDEGLKDEREYNSEKLDKESFKIRKSLFSKLENAYENQREQQYPMKPQLMVPKEHMAFGLWKKSTLHYINTAPLWENLVPLMNFIDNHIKNITVMDGGSMVVYTIAFYRDFEGIEALYLSETFKENGLKVQNIWCKVLRYTRDGVRAGIAIIIHNTPNTPPEAGELCDHLRVPFKCDFKKWTDSENIPNDVKDYTKYAYCCEVNENLLKWFPIRLQLDGTLDLDSLYASKNQQNEDSSEPE